jgi:hypothetical protein
VSSPRKRGTISPLKNMDSRWSLPPSALIGGGNDNSGRSQRFPSIVSWNFAKYISHRLPHYSLAPGWGRAGVRSRRTILKQKDSFSHYPSLAVRAARCIGQPPCRRSACRPPARSPTLWPQATPSPQAARGGKSVTHFSTSF